MRKELLLLAGIALTAAVAQAQTNYPGNGATGFGGPVGQGTLTLSSNGTTLTGTIAAGASGTGALGNEVVIYIDSQAGGFTTTSTFDDTGGGGDTLRKAISGFNGTLRAPLNFATGFAADYAIALGPQSATFGGLWSLSGTGAHGFIQSVNLTPTGAAGPYTFSISLVNIGVAPGGSFTFSTTYGNFNNDIFRSNEAFGNTITDVTTPANTGNLGQDTGLVGFNTFVVIPEPSVMALTALGVIGLFTLRRRLA